MDWKMRFKWLLATIISALIYHTTGGSALSYKGCYKDTGKRDLPRSFVMGHSASLERCVHLCTQHKYKYAGAQFSKECWCGNSPGTYGKRPHHECNMACAGKRSQKCGGSWRNSIYVAFDPCKIAGCSDTCKMVKGKAHCSCNGRRTLGLDGKKCTDTYIGCYIDARNRDLPVHKVLGGHTTIQICITHCQRLGYRYAGLQYKSHCFCGISFGRYGGKRHERECNTACSGNRKQKCGGGWRNSVYSAFTNDNPCKKAGCSDTCKVVKGKAHCGCTGRKVLGNDKKTCVDTYIGCYIDAKNRDLPLLKSMGGSANVQNCVNHCKARGKKYAGLQYMFECWCGDSYGKHSKKRSDSECKMACKGDRSQKCGGSWRNSIYSTETDICKKAGCSDTCKMVKGKTHCSCNGRRTLGLDGKKCTDTYIGCYKDARNRDLPVHKVLGGHTTIQRCITHCQGLGYRYAGLQYRSHCFCGKSYGKYGGKRPERECNTACSGNKKQKCGGGWRNSVYSAFTNDHPCKKAGCSDTCKVVKGKAHCGCTGRMVLGKDKKTCVDTYIGCYKDAKNRDLPVHKVLGRHTTIQTCIAHCQRRRFKYAGLQYKSHCFCGNGYGKYGGKRPEKECNTPCSGNKKQKCGGGWRNSVYSTSANHCKRAGCSDTCEMVRGKIHCSCNGRRTLGLDGKKCTDTYIGCYKDARIRDLPVHKVLGGHTTIQRCITHCQGLGYRYAGLQYKSHCFCGKRYGKYGGKRPERECNTPCSGNKKQKCGGGWRNSVYSAFTNDNPCKKAGCSDTCKVVKGKAHCGCTGGKMLEKDKKTCVDTYIGCYIDAKNRDLPVHKVLGRHTTIQTCIAHCQRRSKNYLIMGRNT